MPNFDFEKNNIILLIKIIMKNIKYRIIFSVYNDKL